MQKMKKDNGDTFNSIMPNLLCVVVVCVFTLLFISWIASIEHRQNLNQICRKYILQMESTGYLTAEQQANLITELKNAGMVTVDTHWNEPNGTTGKQVNYGEEVNLKVTGQMEVVDYSQKAWQCTGDNHDPMYISSGTCPYCGAKAPNGSFGTNFMGLIAGTTTWNVDIEKSSISKRPVGEKVEVGQCLIYVDGNIGGTIKGNISNKNGSIGAYTTIQKGTNRVITVDQTLNIQVTPAAGYTIKSISIDGKEQTITNPTATQTFHLSYKEGGRSFVVSFAPNLVTYKVEHYQMNVDGSGYVLESSQELLGYVGDLVTPDVMEYVGFETPSLISTSLTVDAAGVCKTVVKYYYQRTRYSFTIVPDANVSTQGTSSNGTYYYGATITLNANVSGKPTEAFNLTHWSDVNTGKRYELSSTFQMPAHDVKIKPEISIRTYNIIFDSNGGSGKVDNIMGLGYFDIAQLPDGTALTKKGYKVIGWSTNPDATTPTYDLGQSVSELTIEDEIKLYAVWESLGETKYTVEYYLENEDGTYTQSTAHTKVVDKDIYSTTFVLINDEFVKTSLTDSGDYRYSHATNEENNTINSFYPHKDGSTIIKLYYSRPMYNITITTDSHSTIKGLTSYTETYRHGQNIEIYGINYSTYYEFNKFTEITNTNTKLTALQNGISLTMPNKDITIHVVSKPTEYKIDYILQGGVFENTDIRTSYNVETGTFTIENPVRSHYTFIGWTGIGISEATTTLSIVSGEWAQYGDLQLIANWLIDSFKVIIKNPGFGGSIYLNSELIEFNDKETYEIKFDYDSDIEFIIIPVEFGSIESSILFKSSSDAMDNFDYATKQVIVSKPTTNSITTNLKVHSNMRLETKFTNEEYTIKFHSNNGKNETKTQTAIFNQAVNLEKNTFTRTGYVFKGWSRQAIAVENSESYVEYMDEQEVKNLIKEAGGTFDLYAVWQDESNPSGTISITNNFATSQTVTIKATDNGSGVKAIIISTSDIIKNINEGSFYNTDELTYEITSNGIYYFYVQDNRGNVSRIYPEGEIDPGVTFHKTTLGNFRDTYDDSVPYVITADLPGYTFTFPTLTLKDYEYVGWAESLNSTTGVKTLKPTKTTTYYPIFKPVNTYLVTGIAFNTSVKQLVNNDSSYKSIDTFITDIVLTNVAPAEDVKYVRLNADGADVFGYLDGTTLKIYTTAKTIYTNADSGYMFYNLRNVKSNNLITANNFNTERTESMHWMFAHYGYETTSLDLSKFNTINVINMEKMFAYCGYNKLQSINLNSFITQNVTNMSEMFFAFGYNNLKELTISFNTAKIFDIEGMFAYCGYKKMETLKVLINTSNVQSFDYMFTYTGCENMTSLILGSEFTNKELTSANEMFLYCGNGKLTNVDISMLLFDNFMETSNIFENFGAKNNCTIKFDSETTVEILREYYNFHNINPDLFTY